MKVLITYFETGMGHKSPAIAISDAIKSIKKGCQVRLMDCGAELGVPEVEKDLRAFWNFSLRHPKLFSPIYHLSNSPLITDAILRRHGSKMAAKFREYARTHKPDICVSTHFTAAAGMVQAGMRVSLVTTEPFGAHSFWVVPGVMEYIAASRQVKDRLRSMGVKEPVRIFDYPMKPLRVGKSRKRLRLEFGVDGLCILMTGGGEGISNAERLLLSLMERQYPITIIFICGRNKALYAKLHNLKSGKTKVIVKGFVDNMPELITASDIVAGKTGANTVLESLALKRPFCCTHVMENERELCDFIVKKGLGWHVEGSGELTDLIGSMIKDRSILRRAKDGFRKTSVKSGASRIAKHLLRYA